MDSAKHSVLFKPEVSALYCGDLHGNLFAFEQAVETFEKEKLDVLCFMGDYVDSKHATDTEILHLLKGVIEYKTANPAKVILLTGNHIFGYIKYFSYIVV